MFPKDVQKGYTLYKQQKLISDSSDDYSYGWYLLDPELTIKFDFNGSEIPIFANAIPAILDLEAAQDLDRKK